MQLVKQILLAKQLTLCSSAATSDDDLSPYISVKGSFRLFWNEP